MANKVFIEGTDRTTAAYFGWQDKSMALWGVKEGYKNSADELVNIALEKADNKTLDTYIFPALFLYRHSLEISLKLIYHRFFGRVIKGHELDKLWKKIYDDVVNEINSNDFLERVQEYKEKFIQWSVDDIDFDELKDIFTELQLVDKQSDVWRYLIDNNQSLFFTAGKSVDYLNLKSVFDDVYKKLDYLYFVVSEYLSD